MTILVEVWSDVMCPFCYLGKRRFAEALSKFEGRDQVEVVWRSFQLNPALETDRPIGVNDYLSQAKGISIGRAREMNAHLTEVAKHEGLVFDFDKAVVINTFDAHRFLHFAKAHGRQDEAMQRLFKAYFSEGRNVADHATLTGIGREIGLDAGAVAVALADGSYADEVRADIFEAEELGISGVPFFVFDRKYAVSGAQSSAAFLDVLRRV
jgi:predicted DsbA family dithiol-disulfide isomerase